jgi:hypothetical protein
MEYHNLVNRPARRSIPLTLFALILPFLIAISGAQINSSATSFHSSAPPTSIAVAPHTGGIAPPTGAAAIHNNNVFRGARARNDGHHAALHRSNGTAYFYPYAYGVPVPYGTDDDYANADDEDDPNYQGGPTIFDRRGSGPDSYIPPASPGPAHAQAMSPDNPAAADPAPESPQPSTTLVFKDGHQLEVSNYAIVGQTLYDLSSGRPRKIALADLDLSATQKENDDRGVVFQLPTAQAN